MKRIALTILMAIIAAMLCACVAGESRTGETSIDETLSNLDYRPCAEASGTNTSQPYKPQVIIDGDDRVRVSETDQYPFSAIALMKVHARCGCDWSGTGFMVLPDVLLTAAHCIICPDHGQSAENIELYFGYQPNGDYFKAYTGPTNYYFGTSFPGQYNRENMNWDYGIVRLEENVGYETGYFGLQVKSDAEFDSATMTITGYRDGLLKYDTGKTQVSSGQVIEVHADAEGGNSGGPIYSGDRASAIYIADNERLGMNYGCRITDDVFLKVFSVTQSGRTPDLTPYEGSADVVDPDKTGPNGYVLPQSDTHLYTRDELKGLSVWGLAVARNEIPARHGFIFDIPKLKKYFESKNWYRGTLTRTEFRSIVGILNNVEEANVDTILAMERERGSEYLPRS